MENISVTVWIPEQPSIASHITKTPIKLSLLNSKYTHRLPECDQLSEKESVLFCKQLGYCGPISILGLYCKIPRSYIKRASNFRQKSQTIKAFLLLKRKSPTHSHLLYMQLVNYKAWQEEQHIPTTTLCSIIYFTSNTTLIFCFAPQIGTAARFTENKSFKAFAT